MMIRQKLEKTLTLNFIHLIFFLYIYQEQAKYIQYIMLYCIYLYDIFNDISVWIFLVLYFSISLESCQCREKDLKFGRIPERWKEL